MPCILSSAVRNVNTDLYAAIHGVVKLCIGIIKQAVENVLSFGIAPHRLIGDFDTGLIRELHKTASNQKKHVTGSPGNRRKR